MRKEVFIRSRYNCPPVAGEEPGGGKRITETAGYVPAEIQITEMLLAGARLGEYRREMYDFGADEEVPEDYEGDPTRAPGFDAADGSRIQMDLKGRLERLKAENARRKEEQKEKKEETEEKAPEEK